MLKSSRSRSVRVETDDTGRTRVVKRFASENELSRLFDRRRAERELELLELCRRGGVPVPRPLGLVRREGGFEVATELLDGHRSLAELLSGPRGGPSGSAEPGIATFRALGDALAALHALAIDHPDLHPGNVLVAPDGGIALIDFHAAHRRARPSARRLARDVISLEAALRERTSLAARAALLGAWLVGVGELGAHVPRGAGLDAAARARRLAVVAKRARRWWRGGNAVRESGECLVRRDADLELDAPLARCLADASADDSGAVELDSPAGSRRLFVQRGERASVASAWFASARLLEHDVAVARPLACRPSRPCAAAFELGPDARPFADAAREPRSGESSRRAAAELLGALFDRGLWVPALTEEDLVVERTTGASRAVLVAPRELVSWPARMRRRTKPRLGLSRELVAEGFAAANRGHDAARVERALAAGLGAELADG